MAYEYQEYPKFLYHPTLAPEGKIFHGPQETKDLSRKGWVDTPAKFPKPGRIGASIKLWWCEWEWIFTAVAKVLGLVAVVIGFLKALGLL